MKYDLFISDFDWTLGEAPDIIDEETLKAIKDYESRGGIFCIATGRSFTSIQNICFKHGIDGLVSCFQGAVIADLKSEKVIFSGGIDHLEACDIIRGVEEEGYPVVAWANDTLYYSEDSYYSYMYKTSEKVKFIHTDNVSREIKNAGYPVSKICAVCEEAETDVLVEKLSKKLGNKYTVNSGAKRLVEVINPLYHKGFAVEKIAAYYGVPLDKVITVGDSGNDLELIKGAWHGVCVGDAHEILKKYADEITVPYREKPIKVLLEKYGK